jgi:hypothetical protein
MANAKKRNPADATLRNVRAINTKVGAVTVKVDDLLLRMQALECDLQILTTRVNGLNLTPAVVE